MPLNSARRGSSFQELHVLGGELGNIGYLPHGIISADPLDIVREIPHAALRSHPAERLSLPPNREQPVIVHGFGFIAAPPEISGHFLKIPAFSFCVHANYLLF